jgi:DNA-binding NtrC family response regulator
MKSKLVLIVEENPSWAEIYQLAFTAGRYETVLCTDLDDLFHLLSTTHPDLIFWSHRSRHTEEDIECLDRIQKAYDDGARPLIVIVVNENAYPQIAAYADMIVENYIISDLSGFLTDIAHLFEGQDDKRVP